MKIVCDRNIPCVEEAFSGLGDVVPVPGRVLTRERLSDADVLLVRSVTPVNEALLEGTPVRFVGSATSGIDHVDLEYLENRNIAFAHAPGVNARAVAEYVACALLRLAARRGEPLAGKTLGVIGCGQVGRRVVDIGRVLGLNCLVNDPPLQDGPGQPPVPLVPLGELTAQADIVSVHVPLNRQGAYPTHHLVDERFLLTLPDGAWLINTARGAVVDNDALRRHLEQRDLAAVLDVWEGEPAISTGLLEHVDIGTPHIAGYSAEGKYNATGTLYRAVCAHLGKTPRWTPGLPDTPAPVDLSELDGEAAIHAMTSAAYAIDGDDERLRRTAKLPAAERAAAFDRLRADYPVRREFAAWRCIPPTDPGARKTLRQLGFRLCQ